MSRLLIVSNRLPITVSRDGEELRVERSAGGLATGLSGPHSRSDALWIGWPGDVAEFSRPELEGLHRRLDELRAAPVWIESEDVKAFYEGFSNGVLWPLFHYLLDQLPLYVQHFEVYERVNRRFADEVGRHYRPGDRIWVHDYQLMLLPAMLRERYPDARIGFFLHIPFPSSEIFRILPSREKLLEGLLGADLVGFHTAGYMRQFGSSILRVLGVAADVDRVLYQAREVRLGVFPMGIDVDKFVSLTDSEDVQTRAGVLREKMGEKILLGIDRLDYTKGIRRRLLAYEAMLRRHPEYHGRVRLIQVAVPSRESVGAYQEFRHEVDAMIGRINGQFGTADWVPIHYLYRSLSDAELVSMYRAADVMLITPVRDGMNLVAKEFVASRTDDDGVLVLSEFAGAASELAEALNEDLGDPEAARRTLLDFVERNDPNDETRSPKGRGRAAARRRNAAAALARLEHEVFGDPDAAAGWRPTRAESRVASTPRLRPGWFAVLRVDAAARRAEAGHRGERREPPKARAEFATFLCQMHHVHSILDPGLESAAESDSRVRQIFEKSHLRKLRIEQDLEDLGRSEIQDVLPSTLRFTTYINKMSEKSATSLIGFLYVKEGATNGNKFIAKKLRATMGLGDDKAMGYLDPHGEDQRRCWNAFKENLNQLDLTDDEQAECVEVAQETFRMVMDVSKEVDSLNTASV